MDWTYIIAAAVAIVAIAEMIQVIILNYSVRQINKKLAIIIPEGESADKILSDTLYRFMADLQSDPQKAQVVGGFIRGAFLAGAEEIAKKYPILGGGAQANQAIEKLASKNPWVGLGLGIMQAVGPQVSEALQNRSQQQKGGGKSTNEW